MNIFVSNISFKANEDNLRGIFEEFGAVASVKIIMDNYTGRSKGFGFVEMPESDEAKRAIDSLNDTDFYGKNLVVNEARPKTAGGSGGGGNRRDNNRSNSGGGYQNRRSNY